MPAASTENAAIQALALERPAGKIQRDADAPRRQAPTG